jgi:murein DD-endopeptidase MepM/ murein hydrolase activator NlpD
MIKFLHLLRKTLTPITIMVIPHEDLKSLSLKVPAAGIALMILLSVIGSVQVFSLTMKGLDYSVMEEKVNFYNRQFWEWNTTIASLKEIEGDFKKLFALGSQEKVLEKMGVTYSGDVDWASLQKEIEKAVEEVDGIRNYLRVQKDLYMATPKGFPVAGSISSRFGMREKPSGVRAFHAGTDVSAKSGTPVRATADGIVSYSGWANNGGYVVALEHGCGYSTIYAHNKKNGVNVGQRVERGDVLAWVGSTGNSTGPHVHYEVLKNGKKVNPQTFLLGVENVRK